MVVVVNKRRSLMFSDSPTKHPLPPGRLSTASRRLCCPQPVSGIPLNKSYKTYILCLLCYLGTHQSVLVHHNSDHILPLRHRSQPCPRICISEGSAPTSHKPHAPTSPHASVFPIGPTTVYPITSRTTRTCSAVSGCSYISVFIAGNTYVGVVGASARSTDVCSTPRSANNSCSAHVHQL